MVLFALTMVHGPNWDASRQIREQDAWDEHAVFMDGLVDDGFMILGGPVGDGERVLHVVEAADEPEIMACLGRDPWSSMGLLRIAAVEPWALLLDGRQSGTQMAVRQPEAWWRLRSRWKHRRGRRQRLRFSLAEWEPSIRALRVGQ
jgi:hypothetical protein